MAIYTPSTAIISLLIFLGINNCHGSSIVKRDLEPGQQECVSALLIHLTNGDMTCINVANAITPTLVATDIVSELDSVSNVVYAEFCRPSCGQHILAAWETCGLTQGYENEVNLVTGLCGISREGGCYESTQQIFDFIEDVEACSPGDTCTEECVTLIEDSHIYGCCRDIPVAFRSAAGESDLMSIVDFTFDKCFNEAEEPCERILIVESNFLSNLVDINPSLSPQQIVCIDNEISSNDELDMECKAAASKLILQINSNSLLDSISEDQSALAVFCSSTCGPAIIESWMSCNVYNDIQAEADLLTGLCGINQGVPCWAQYNEILFASDDTANCAVRNNEIVCPITCSRVLQNVIDDYGCCFELLIDYLDAVFIPDPRTVDEVTDTLFNVCEVERDNECPTTALTTDPTATNTAISHIIPAIAVFTTATVASFL